MADFKTHVSSATAVCGVFASLLMSENLVTPGEALLLTLIGALGGIAPDLDLDTGKALGILATLLYMLAAFGVMLFMGNGYPVWQLWLAILLGLLMIKYAVLPGFKNWTRHRGIFHSLLAASFFWFLTTALASHVFRQPTLLSWLLGCMMFTGYVVHLLMDEIYSVDFLGRKLRLKKSWGTAFKLAALGDPRGVRNSFFFLVATLTAYAFTPDGGEFHSVMKEMGSKTYATLANFIRQV